MESDIAQILSRKARCICGPLLDTVISTSPEKKRSKAQCWLNLWGSCPGFEAQIEWILCLKLLPCFVEEMVQSRREVVQAVVVVHYMTSLFCRKDAAVQKGRVDSHRGTSYAVHSLGAGPWILFSVSHSPFFWLPPECLPSESPQKFFGSLSYRMG